MASLLDASGRNQDWIVLQSQPISQIVSRYGPELQAGSQRPQPLQPLHCIDIDHQTRRVALTQTCHMAAQPRPEEHTAELQSLMSTAEAVVWLKKKTNR